MIRYLFLFLPCVAIFADLYIPKYVWNLGFAIAADQSPFKAGLPEDYSSLSHAFFVDPKKYIKKEAAGKIIWVQRDQLDRFYQKVLPYLKHRFVLVVNDGDQSFCLNNSCCKKLVDDPRVIAVFAQNVADYCYHPKIYPIPIGIDFHSVARLEGYFGEKHHSILEQEVILDDILSTLLPTNQRKKRVALDFTHNDFHAFGESRTEVIHQLTPRSFVDHLPTMSRHASWKLKGEYAFVVSPHGYGLDCHRTWEGLILGNIVIVKTSPLDKMYKGLPVVIVKDWSEVNEKNLDLWLEKYGDAFSNRSYREKLTHSYWMNKIRKTAGVK